MTVTDPVGVRAAAFTWMTRPTGVSLAIAIGGTAPAVTDDGVSGTGSAGRSSPTTSGSWSEAR